MERSIGAGWTDYSHQTFEDILSDLIEIRGLLQETVTQMEGKIDGLTQSGYWNRKVNSSFVLEVKYSIKVFKNYVKELDEIHRELQIEVMEHHRNRLYAIARIGEQINTDYGRIMNNEWSDEKKDYGAEEFYIVEDIYKDGKGMAGSLLDMSNMAGRLKDFLGKKTIKNMENKNGDIGNISNITIGNNSVLNIGNDNKIFNLPVNKGNFEELRMLFKENQVSEEDINELDEILKEEKPDEGKKEFGPKVKGWIAKMLGKAKDGSWAVAVGAAGKLLADGLKYYNGWFGA